MGNSIGNSNYFSISNDEEHVMHSKSDNKETMINDEAYKVVKELFKSLKKSCKNNLESIFHHAKQIILLMIPNGEQCHYLAVKTLSASLRGITFKHHSDFYCLGCLHSFATKK